MSSPPSTRSNSASPLLPSLLSGTLFGLSLLLSGVYSPRVILSQLRLTNFHMLESFLTASAASALVVFLASRSGYAPVQHRPARKLAFTDLPYSANILGGGLLGVGMGLTGACPGTVLVQIAGGVSSGVWVGMGGLAGGLVWSVIRGSVLRVEGTQEKVGDGEERKRAAGSGKAKNGTLQAHLGLSTNTLMVLYEAMCLAMIVASISFAPSARNASYVPPAVGGLFIGLAQAATMLLTRKTVGVSGAYSDVGAFLRGRGSLLTPSVAFGLGVLGGSAVGVTQGLGGGAGGLTGVDTVQHVSPTMAVLGGVLSIFGASLAGGCTSGHGISGMATFSTASFVTVAAMFAGGIAAASLL